MSTHDHYASVRYVVDDVQAASEFYTAHLGFTMGMSAAPAFAEVFRGPLRLLLSGPLSSGYRVTPEEAKGAGRNRIQLVFDDLEAEMTRLREAGVAFRTEVFAGPGGKQVLLCDPAGNLVELFEPTARG